jgi:uncharacterized protein (DUF2164 family)
MTIELDKADRKQAIESIERYFRDELDQKVGNIQAGALLNFLVEEIGPLIYNRAIAEAQERMLMRVQELDVEIHEDPFRYWARRERGR